MTVEFDNKVLVDADVLVVAIGTVARMVWFEVYVEVVTPVVFLTVTVAELRRTLVELER
ncbi:MAG: hypothetical protein HY247_05705 [archaeon]|nr:MAG: hypothetical protein HY247_05705 [archaeon]